MLEPVAHVFHDVQFDEPARTKDVKLSPAGEILAVVALKGVKRFFEPGLRHRNSQSEHALPSAVSELYALLEDADFRGP